MSSRFTSRALWEDRNESIRLALCLALVEDLRPWYRRELNARADSLDITISPGCTYPTAQMLVPYGRRLFSPELRTVNHCFQYESNKNRWFAAQETVSPDSLQACTGSSRLGDFSPTFELAPQMAVGSALLCGVLF